MAYLVFATRDAAVAFDAKVAANMLPPLDKWADPIALADGTFAIPTDGPVLACTDREVLRGNTTVTRTKVVPVIVRKEEESAGRLAGPSRASLGEAPLLDQPTFL